MRLIDADALLEALAKMGRNYQTQGKILAQMYYVDDVTKLVTNAPAVQREGLESAIKDLIFIDKKLSNKKILDLNKIYGRWFIKNRHLLISLIPAAPADKE